VINGQTRKIICAAECAGATHDLELFKQSGVHLLEDILLVADKGYQGITSIHAFSLTPFKKPRGGELTDLQKLFNRNLSSYRITIEHVNRTIKRFKIFQNRYRNKQCNHLLRFSIVCGICNFELEF